MFLYLSHVYLPIVMHNKNIAVQKSRTCYLTVMESSKLKLQIIAAYAEAPANDTSIVRVTQRHVVAREYSAWFR